MGFYTVLSLNGADVDVRDIFASAPPPPPLLKVPNPTFMVVSWYCGANGFNKKTLGTIPTPYHLLSSQLRKTSFFVSLSNSKPIKPLA